VNARHVVFGRALSHTVGDDPENIVAAQRETWSVSIVVRDRLMSSL